MNYTLIGYSERTLDYDRWGDLTGEPGAFETFWTTDKAELIETWAVWSFSGNYETLNLLIDGVPDSYLSDDASLIWDELNNARKEQQHELFLAKKAKDDAEALRKSEALALENIRRAELERLRDLKTLTALKKKLGVS